MSKRKFCEIFEACQKSPAVEPGAAHADATVGLLRDRGAQVEYISDNSWIAVLKSFDLPEGGEFHECWESHPADFQTIKMYGKDVKIPRYQQAYGQSYTFSGIRSHAIAETALIARLRQRLNNLFRMDDDATFSFNMCLCNWYEPDHYIGPHSDDTRQLVRSSPIASLSWGCTRAFALTPKIKDARKRTLKVQSGDLVIMGGECQNTHKHEITKLKKGEERGKRISFTFRCFV